MVSEERHGVWPFATTAAVRAAFGILWAIAAFLTWRSAFAVNYVGYLQNASHGQPGWLQPWFSLWLSLITPAAGFFIWATRIIETLIALGLLLGLARKWTYIIGTVFSLLIWSTAGGFGGPYAAGASNLGPALVYVLVFVALMIFELMLGTNPYSVDYYLERRAPAWASIAELAPAALHLPKPPRLSWRQQGLAILGIIVAIVFFFGTLQSTLNAAPATPANAAAAVSPLQLASTQPGAPHEATLPPLLGNGDSVDITITATDTNVDIANGVQYQAWTFNDSVPGPAIHVRQGQTVNVTFVNHGRMQHSIDFHAAQVAPDVAYRSINPDESLQFSFVAAVPGVYMYHCGTPPVLMHIANGMYGAIIVDPAQGMPSADVSYVLVQGEWYTQQVQAKLMGADFTKMQAAMPDEVVFNGVAFQYKDHPLTAKVGQRVRLYVVDAGPNLYTAFHVIGGIFSAIYPDGNPAHALNGVQTYQVAPGQGVVFDISFPQPGKYIFVDHSMRSAGLGAQGIIDVTE